MPDQLFPTEKGEGLSDNKVRILIFSVLLIPMLLLAYFVGRYRDPEIQKKLEELRQLAAETPVYPDFKELFSFSGGKSAFGYYTVYYDVPAYSPGLEAIKKFYLDALVAKGWSLSEEDSYGRESVQFRKGEYSIYIQPNYGQPADWDYSVSYGWRAP